MDPVTMPSFSSAGFPIEGSLFEERRSRAVFEELTLAATTARPVSLHKVWRVWRPPRPTPDGS